MYQLDLSDARLALPVAIYEDPSGPGGSTRLVPKTPAARGGAAPRSVAFFAPDRPGIASLPVYEQYDSTHGQTFHGPAQGRESEHASARPLFYLLPADVKDYTAATVPFYEYRDEPSGRQFYSVDPPNSNVHARWTRRLLGRVWRNPARLRLW